MFVAGAGLAQVLPALPGPVALWLAAAAGAVVCAELVGLGHHDLRVLAAFAVELSADLINAALQAQHRLNDGLAEAHQDEVFRLVLRVAELRDGHAQR